jgi:hypothetical protein
MRANAAGGASKASAGTIARERKEIRCGKIRYEGKHNKTT